MDLVLGERRARIGNHVLDATLVHGYDVGIAFHHEHTVFLGYGFLCLV